jgi:hypothetical protein
VFISYCHEDTHGSGIRELWLLLRSCGVDARIDLAAAERRQDWALWMADQIRHADHIVVIASRAYRRYAEGRGDPMTGRGVQWEARLIRDAFYRDQRSLNRFLPVVLPGQSIDGVPDFLAAATSTVYHIDEVSIAGARALVRVLTERPAHDQPSAGPWPDSDAERSRPSNATPTSSTPGKYAVDARGANNVQVGDGNAMTVYVDPDR